ncbi:MAG: 2,3-bisphosphoglycerate-independent phosphoglycerate mutase [Planctomycetes bacterium]|nr:2,3-bisphosphoglycerate-independent phosphoglycerate mutase [Planctomycetota bacterium]
MAKPNPVLLAIMDGWGIAPPGPTNAISAANPEFFNGLWATEPHTAIEASGEEVGLPVGQFGNSEVGHLNLGAGRIVWQEITRINKDIREARFAKNPALAKALAAAKPESEEGGCIHLMGLVSDGGVHSMDTHYFALLDWLKDAGFPGERVFFHVITDGRDTNPHGAVEYVDKLMEKMAQTGIGRVATVCGRYYAMDRDKRWDRTEKAWDVYTLGEGEIVPDALEAIRESYKAGVTDEFITPKLITEHGRPLSLIHDGDVVLWFNFRADRARQFCWALTKENFDGFRRRKTPKAMLVTMTPYAADIPAEVMYAPQQLKNTLGEYLAGKMLRQFRCAETEKYAHVTYFFNGGAEQPNPGEERALVQSPKVATYDLQPEMSAAEVSNKVEQAVRSGRFDFVLVNYANPDMTGHTGVFEAAVAGIQAVDKGLKQIVGAAKESGFAVLLTADHGNAEEMQLGDRVSTQHSHNKVPLVLTGQHPARKLRDGGKLADVAPTVLELMGLDKPPEMTGESLLS